MKAGNLVKDDQRMMVQGKVLVVTLVGLMLLVACQGSAATGALIAQLKDDFCPTPGKYTVMKQGAAESTALFFRLVQDDCPARVKILTTGPAAWFGDLP